MVDVMANSVISNGQRKFQRGLYNLRSVHPDITGNIHTCMMYHMYVLRLLNKRKKRKLVIGAENMAYQNMGST